MECRYVAILIARSVSLSPQDPLVVYDDASQRAKATITTTPDEILHDADMSVVMAVAMLKGLLAALLRATLPETLATELDAVRGERHRAAANHPYLVIESSTELDPVFKQERTDFEGYEVTFDAFNKPQLRSQFRHLVDRIVTAIVVASSRDARFDFYSDELYLISPEGKRIFSYSPTFGNPTFLVSSTAIGLRGGVESYLRAGATRGFESVESLLRAAVDHQNEPLRRFLAAWSAVEIFTNKVFSSYEQRWFQALSAARSRSQVRQLERVREVMREKYRLLDKFTIIISILEPEEAEAMIEQFATLKKIRDQLLHGGVEEENLPVQTAIVLLRRCLVRHAAGATA